MPTVWLNGSLVEEEQASVSVRDTGLLHSAGVFTTMRAYGGKVFRLQQHLARLRRSCDVLSIPLQYKDQVLTSAVEELLGRENLGDARLRLTITRGAARNDPGFGLHLQPNIFLTATALEHYPPEFYTRGMTVVLLDDQKLNPYDIQAGHKTLNYFSRLAALRTANGRGAGEALWFNVHNYLQSGSISNVFVVKGGELITPPTGDEILDGKTDGPMLYPRSAVLPGITRQAVIDLAAAAGIRVRLKSINVNQLLEADEVFLTNSIMQVMPVCRLERSAVGDEKPGPVARSLAESYVKEVGREQ